MKDRLVAGGLSGIIAGLIEYIFSIFLKALGWTDRYYGQFSDIIFNNRVYTGILGTILSILTHLALTTVLGVIFVYILAWTSSRYYLLKGAGYGFVLWFSLSGLGTIFRMPLFIDIPEKTAFSLLAGALVFGLTLAYSLRLMDRKSALL